MRLCGRLLLVLFLVHDAAQSGGPTVAVQPGQSLDRILNAVLSSSGKAKKRVLYLVVDPTPSLVKGGFADALQAALQRHRKSLAQTRIGWVACDTSRSTLEATDDLDRVASSTRTALAGAKNAYRDVYAAVRHATKLLKGVRGQRDLLLVTLENGDLFEDVEKTAAGLRKARVRLWVAAREAFLADPYAVRNRTGVPKDLASHSADGPFLDIPWYWLGQKEAAVGSAPSGYPYWALSRLAAVAKGRVFLYYPSSGKEYRCAPHAGMCPFCPQDQLPPEYPYNRAALRALAPHFGRPAAALAAATKSPIYRAVLRAWKRASDAGLVLGRPGIDKRRRLSKRATGQLAPLGGTVSFPQEIRRAKDLIAACDAIERILGPAVAKHQASPRNRALAIAELTRVMTRLTRLNLLYFVAFCKETGPAATRSERGPLDGPEVPPLRPKRITGISSTPMSLSHGVEPFLQMFLPGGKALDKELRAFDQLARAFWIRYKKTPFAMVLRRAGIARWRFVGVGTATTERDPRLPGSAGDDTTTGGRPDRPEAGSSGDDGPSSGGG